MGGRRGSGLDVAWGVAGDVAWGLGLGVGLGEGGDSITASIAAVSDWVSDGSTASIGGSLSTTWGGGVEPGIGARGGGTGENAPSAFAAACDRF